MIDKTFRWAALALIAAAVLAGCAATPEPTEPTPTENSYGGFAVDPPADDEVILTIEGDSVIDFTYGELQRLADVEVDIVEPFVDRQQSFTGVPLAELLDRAGIAPDERVETVALNDYRYSDTALGWASNGAILAVFRDDELIPMDQGGPIRIVFAADSPAFGTLDAWNWSLRTIAVVD